PPCGSSDVPRQDLAPDPAPDSTPRRRSGTVARHDARMSEVSGVHWLDRPVDEATDHVLGPAGAEITLVEYGSYDCPHCRAANERIAAVRDQFGNRVRYVFRHRPVT